MLCPDEKFAGSVFIKGQSHEYIFAVIIGKFCPPFMRVLQNIPEK